MTNPTDQKQQYEGAILQQLVKNAEVLAVIKFKTEQNQPLIDKIDTLEEKLDTLEEKVDGLQQKVDKIYDAIGTVKWVLVTIGLAIVANLFSEPINSFIFHR